MDTPAVGGPTMAEKVGGEREVQETEPLAHPGQETAAAQDKDADVSDSDRPPDGGWGWMVVFGATVTHFLLVGTARCLGVIYLSLRERYQSNSANTAWVAATFNTARTLTAPLASLLCERFGCRAVAFCGGLLFSAGMIISAFSTSLLYFFFSFGLVAGLGGVLIFTPAYIMVGQYFDKRKGTAMGLATIGSGLGNVVLAPLINFLVDEYSLYGTMLILGAVTLHTCAVALLYRPRKRRRAVKQNASEIKVGDEVKVKEDGDRSDWKEEEGTVADKGLNVADSLRASLRSLEDPDFKVQVKTGQKEQNVMSKEDSHPTESKKGSVFKPLTKCLCCTSVNKGSSNNCTKDSLFCNTTFMIYCCLMAGMQYAIMGTLVFVPGFAVEKDVPKTQASLLLSIYGFVDLGSRFLYAFLFDLKVIRKRRRHPYAVVGLVFGASTILIAFMPDYVSLAVAVAINALCEAAFHSQRATIISEFVPASQASVAVGLMIASQGVGNITGPPFAGFLRDVYGSHSICFLFGGGVFSLTALAFALRIFYLSQATKRCSCCTNR